MGIVNIQIVGDSTNGVKAVNQLEQACDRAKSVVWDMAKSFAPLALGAAAFTKLSAEANTVIPAMIELGKETGKLQRIAGMTAESASELIYRCA